MYRMARTDSDRRTRQKVNIIVIYSAIVYFKLIVIDSGVFSRRGAFTQGSIFLGSANFNKRLRSGPRLEIWHLNGI